MSTPITIRVLGPADAAALDAFLRPHLSSSMFLLGNSREAGLSDTGQPYSGAYVAACAGDHIAGVVAHYWNGNLIFQAPDHSAALWQAAARASGRAIKGLIGPAEQLAPVLADPLVAAVPRQLDETEPLYELPLADLRVPAALASGKLRTRRSEPGDLDLLTDWNVAFALETLGDSDGPELRERMRDSVERMQREGRTWVLEDGGALVATSSFNAVIAEAVQVGRVWTPPPLRGRGYARAVVAGSLRDARMDGHALGLLFTGEGNIPAQRAYAVLGFRRVGTYRVVLLRAPLTIDDGR